MDKKQLRLSHRRTINGRPIPFTVFLILICFTTSGWAQLRPFPQGIDYSGAIKPSLNQNTLNTTVASYYDHWVSRYLLPTTMPGGYYVKGECTGCQVPSKGTSEGHGYGMIISALMAGHDANAKIHFDGLYNFFDTHRSTINNELMGWNVAVDERSNAFSSATDGDMDIAYALLLAHYQWGSAGTINYLQEAIDMINLGLKGGVVHTASKRTMLGDWDNNQLTSRPSDWMTGHFRAYKAATGDTFWDEVANTTYGMIQSLHTNAAANTGLVPDFVVSNPAVPAAPYFLEGANDGNYYYNACRYPLRVAMDYAHYGTPEAKMALDKLLNWIKPATSNNPMNILPGYKMNGSSIGTNYDDAVFIAPIVAACAVDGNHQAYMDAGWDRIINMKVNYFSDTYNLLCMLFMSGNWWAPVPTGNQDPTVFFITPQNNQSFVIGTAIPAEVTATDNDGVVTQVQFYINNVLHSTDTSEPFGFTATNLALGTFEFKAIATDDAGAVSQPAIVNIEVIPEATLPPTTTITAPAEGTNFLLGDPITISADASDLNGCITKVEFYHGTTLLGSDTTAPYSVIWSNAELGEYTITAKATNCDQLSGVSNPVHIVVAPHGIGCTAPAWDAGAVYHSGNVVSHNNNEWRAKWWTHGQEPGTTGQWGVWEDMGPCMGLKSAQPKTLASPIAASAVFPNPFMEHINFSIDVKEVSTVKICILSITGTELILIERDIQTGFEVIQVDASQLDPGVYVYQLTIDGAVSTGRITKR